MADFTTSALVKEYAGITSGADDASIASIIGAVSAMLSTLVGHDFDGAVITGELHSWPPSSALVLRKPAASIEAVREAGTTLAPTDYQLVDERILYRLAGGVSAEWLLGRRNIAIDYTTTGEVPSDLELASTEVCAFMVKQSALGVGSARLGLSGQANGDTGSAEYFAQTVRQLPFATMVLSKYQSFA